MLLLNAACRFDLPPFLSPHVSPFVAELYRVS